MSLCALFWWQLEVSTMFHNIWYSEKALTALTCIAIEVTSSTTSAITTGHTRRPRWVTWSHGHMVTWSRVCSHTCSYNVPDTGLCQMLTSAREGGVKTEIGHIMFPCCSSSLAQYAQCRVIDIQIYLDPGFSNSAFTGFSFIFSSWPAV